VLRAAALALALVALLTPSSAQALTFEVNSTADDGDSNLSDDKCANASEGKCTLRAAIQNANASKGPHDIKLVSYLGGLRLLLESPLPYITETVHIDETDTEGSWNPPWEIEPANDGVLDGLVFAKGGSIRHVKLSGFNRAAIYSWGGYWIDIQDVKIVVYNCGRGIELEGPATIGSIDHELPFVKISHYNENTGCTEVGAGILSTFPEDKGWYSVDVENTRIAGQAGPGILATGRVRLAGVRITNNAGPGVEIASSEGDLAMIRIDVAPGGSFVGKSVISGNSGAGLFVDTGTINVWGSIEVTGNHSRGLHSVAGDVRLGDPSAQSSLFPRTVSNNGGGYLCARHDMYDGGPPERIEEPCEGGGLLAEDGQVDAWSTEIIGNDGDGVRASARARLGFSKVCDNTAVQIVGNPIDLETVDTCGQQPGGTPSSSGSGDGDGSGDAGESGGGCSFGHRTPGNQHALMLLLAACFIAAARKRVK